MKWVLRLESIDRVAALQSAVIRVVAERALYCAEAVPPRTLLLEESNGR
ncbi:hypothetical protein [Sphingomonas sp.]|nr:hypothetical protein [Sphingomonas sp.]